MIYLTIWDTCLGMAPSRDRKIIQRKEDKMEKINLLPDLEEVALLIESISGKRITTSNTAYSPAFTFFPVANKRRTSDRIVIVK